MRKLRRLASWFLVIALLVGVIPMKVHAQENERKMPEIVATVPGVEEYDESEDLFSGYVEKQLYGLGDASFFSSDYVENFLPDELNIKIYRELKKSIENIAAVGGSTVIKIKLAPSDISVSSANSNWFELLSQEYDNKIAFDLLVPSVLADCPYELYWFDKTETYTMDAALGQTSSTYYISELIFTFQVIKDYQAVNYNEKNPMVTSNVSAVGTAVANAKAVVSDNQEKADMDKLNAYKEYICSQVSYNYDALDIHVAYGDPWQLIYVFDDNVNTNVVCEGYSKAFQYLCELSNFDDINFACYSVTGELDGGPHMWNVVRLNGTNYLADITNVDDDPSGEYASLYMNSNPYAGDAYGYTIKVAGGAQSAVYEYDEDSIALYPAEVRALGVLCSDGHDLTHHDRKEADHNNAGNIEYWQCDICLKYFKNANGNTEIAQEDTVIAKIPHDYAADWSYNVNVHWHQCSCGSRKDIGIHDFENDCDTTCETCGYIRIVTHQWVQVWAEDGNAHHLECRLCGLQQEEIRHTSGRWIKDYVGWWYQYQDGCYPANRWCTIGGQKYWFNAAGYMHTGWLKLDNKWYYMNSSGAMATGWVQSGGTWYYMNQSGVMQTGWALVNGTWYYMDASGAMMKGWQFIGGAWYYLDPINGNMYASCWIGNYYVKADGSMAVSERVDNGRYYVDHNGLWVPGL